MGDLEINTFAVEACWKEEWMMVRLAARGKARGRPPSNNSSILSHAAPTPARAVPVPKASAARPNVEGHSATVDEGTVPLVEGHSAAAVEDAGRATEGSAEPGQSADEPANAPANAAASGEAEACPICDNELLESEETQRLTCGHATHTECVSNYMRVTGKTMAESCPYRCHQSPVAVMVPL